MPKPEPRKPLLRRSKALSAEIVHWEREGQSISGQWTDTQSVAVRGKMITRYILTDANGKAWAILASMQLDEALQGVSHGTWVEVVFVRKVTLPNKQTLNVLEVYQLEEAENESE